MASLEVGYIGLKLKNPFIIASSGLTDSMDKLRLCEDFGAGGVVLKSIFEEQFVIERGKGKKTNYQIFIDNQKQFYDKKIFTPLDEYIEFIADAKKTIDIPVIASLNCISDSSLYEGYLKEIEKAGADAIEVNMALMPKSFKQTPYEIETHIFKIIYEVRQNLKIPIIAKIGPYFTSIPKIAKGLNNNGASALVLFNRFYQPEIDIEEMTFKSRAVFSSASDLSVALRWISILYKETNMDLVGATGVHDGMGAVKVLLAGATAIELCSILYLRGMDYLEVMKEEMKKWMEKNELERIDQIRGVLSQRNSHYPELFERFQYIDSMEGYFKI
jgi:dihydroorotate dehydrogenase (fumarate)